MKFSGKILQISKFIENYDKIQIISIQNQLQLPLMYSKNEIEWNYMLSAASILAQAEDGKGQDAALRIAQSTLTFLESETHKNAAAVVLHTLTNNPAINLAISRNLVSADYFETIPIPLRFDMSQRNITYKIETIGTQDCSLNKFQHDAYTAFFETDRLSISAPTSAGKSFLLHKLLLDAIILSGCKKIVYIVPTRALIQQVESDLKVVLKENLKQEFDVSVIPLLKEKSQATQIFVFTQERLQWLLNDYAEFIPDIIFIDEAQKIADSARGIILENVMNEITKRNPKVKMVFASPMTSNPEKLLGYNKRADVKVTKLVGEYTAVNQNLIWMHQDKTNKLKWNIDYCLNSNMTNIGNIEIWPATKPFHRIARVAHKLSPDNLGSMIFAHGKAAAEDIAYLLYQLENDPESLPNEIKELIDLIKKGIHKDYILVEVLKRGIAFHYGDMPLLVKSAIEELFKTGAIKYLVCTSTLLEGVNLPASSIFIRGIKKGKTMPMSRMDFWNLAGRAGRQGREFQGNIICIDSDDTSIWQGEPPKNKERYTITSILDKVLMDETNLFIDFINETNHALIFKQSEYAHALSFLLNEKTKAQDLVETDLTSRFERETIINVDQAINKLLLDCKDIPLHVLAKNIGVHPRCQQNLLNYFNSTLDNELNDLIPVVPSERNAYNNYIKIVSRIFKYISGDEPKLSPYYTIVAINWMRGYGLARIISDNILYDNKRAKPIGKPAVIRNTMGDIEQWARFRFLKFMSCYNRILALCFAFKGRNDLVEIIPEKMMNIWLEFGASMQTQISLMGLGLSRSTSLELSEKMINECMSVEECLEWIRKENIDILDINEIYKQEIKRMIERY